MFPSVKKQTKTEIQALSGSETIERIWAEFKSFKKAEQPTAEFVRGEHLVFIQKIQEGLADGNANGR